MRQYRERAFFYLANYEQVVADGPEIQRLVAPDVVILDEAQRIKNWRTKTAHAVKRLESRYAFVLTGTPLENRTDDVYSIVQFLDPGLLGPLFRFNGTFYELDDHGRPVGYKNLGELQRRLKAVLLRRRKEEVETQLPPRIVNSAGWPTGWGLATPGTQDQSTSCSAARRSAASGPIRAVGSSSPRMPAAWGSICRRPAW